MRNLLTFALFAVATAAWGQSYVPPPYAAYQWTGTAWTPSTTAASAAAISYTPPAAALYCLNAGLNKWVPADSSCFGGGGGSGTVTSVALTGSANLFSSTPGTAVTISGTLNVDSQLLAQAANCVLAGPTNGAAAAPTCRVFVNADFPSGLTFQSPTFVTPALGTPASGVITNLTGTCTACTANAVPAANLIGATLAVGVTASSLTSFGVAPALGTPASGVITNLTGTCTACTANAATSAMAATNLAGGAIGSLPYQSAAATTLFVSGNTTTTAQFLTSTGTGAAAQAPTLTGSTGTGNVMLSASPTTTGTLAAAAITMSGNITMSSGGTILPSSGALFIRAGSASNLNLGANNTNSLWVIASAGGLSGAGNFSAGTYSTAANCAAVGTAASPSVVSCASASAGAFSCDVAASAATCTINTTAVTANSEIFVQEVADEGTRLSVTCNTAPTVTPGILVATKTAATGFTINMPTITTNPACFNYRILN